MKKVTLCGLVGASMLMGCNASPPNIVAEHRQVLNEQLSGINQAAFNVTQRAFTGTLPIYDRQIEWSGDTVVFYTRHIPNQNVSVILGPHLPEEYKLSTSPRTNQVLITFPNAITEQTKNHVEWLINQIDIAPPEIGLLVYVVGVARGNTKDVSAQINSLNLNGAGVSPSANIDMQPGEVGSPGVPRATAEFGISAQFGQTQLDVLLRTLELDRKIVSYSIPQMRTLNYEEASIIQVRQLGLQEITNTPSGLITSTRFIDVLDSLVFRAFVAPDNYIYLHSTVEVSSIGSIAPGFSAPPITTRTTTSTTKIQNGVPLIISSYEVVLDSYIKTGAPPLNEVPILNQLLKGEFRGMDVETILFVALPYIIEPGSSPNTAPLRKEVAPLQYNTLPVKP